MRDWQVHFKKLFVHGDNGLHERSAVLVLSGFLEETSCATF